MVFKKELLGHWKETGDPIEYVIDTINGMNGKMYTIKVIDSIYESPVSGIHLGDTSHLLGILIIVKGNFFLDCSLDLEERVGNQFGDWSKYFLLPVHNIYRINSMRQNSIEISTLEPDSLSVLLKKGRFKIRHELIDKDNILLLEKSQTLQQKLIELEKFPSVYKKSDLIRIK